MNLNLLEYFPYPNFRKYQKEVIEKIGGALSSGVKCILLEAPVGFGKSAVNITVARASGLSFYSTPQLALIDQILRDKYIGKYVTEIKGRENYKCVKDIFGSSTVKSGLCRRVKGFKCDRFEECPYYKQKLKAYESQIVLCSFAYLILESRVKEEQLGLGKRNLLIIDEGHSIDRYLIDHISVELSPYSPNFDIYSMYKDNIYSIRDIDDAVDVVEYVVSEVREAKDEIKQLTLEGIELSVKDVELEDKYEDFIFRANLFIDSYSECDWVVNRKWTTYKGEKYMKIILQPVYAKFFMPEFVWKRANIYMISSATILEPNMYIRETGLDLVLNRDEILYLKVPSTFPPENRPIIDVTVGKLTKVNGSIEKNFDKAIGILEDIIENETILGGKNLAVHVNSYDLAEKIYQRLYPKYGDILIHHTSTDREEKLLEWINSRGKVFICVAFTEGQDWIGDICEAQVLFKAPFPDASDKRIARRLEKKEWKWYNYETLKQIIQAYGRAVRSEEDKANFYIIDSSALRLIRWSKKVLPSWFKEVLPEK